ncbi:hypothetical protein TNIN_88621 [Trichonephila inaurata madagascariensis]|uniref:Uncharacterized protein n=1 Tax=Trichonephila inaurata madagascariensis TaxID=2747483 RepID=A0A8X7CC72_9ARAC|nr:hypothetical protein TNIN_88621 [Trichonephila inaurata madagascariensis]
MPSGATDPDSGIVKDGPFINCRCGNRLIWVIDNPCLFDACKMNFPSRVFRSSLPDGCVRNHENNTTSGSSHILPNIPKENSAAGVLYHICTINSLKEGRS